MLTRISEAFRELFELHKNERRGFIVILTMIMVFVSWIFYEHNLRSAGEEPSILVQEKLLVLKVQQEEGKKKFQEEQGAEYFTFDPNTLDKAGWIKLGFSPKQVNSILKYRSSGVIFRIKRDVAKLFVVSDAKYSELEPFIDLPELAKRAETSSPKVFGTDRSAAKQEPKFLILVELNTAGVSELEALPYIGPKTAAQIISFRDLLGGFHSKEQLAEVYYLRDKPEAVQRLMELVTVLPGQVRKIPLNHCEAAALADHPLISWKEAKALVNYRTHHGPFADLEDVMNCKLISEDLFRKIAPYLAVE